MAIVAPLGTMNILNLTCSSLQTASRRHTSTHSGFQEDASLCHQIESTVQQCRMMVNYDLPDSMSVNCEAVIISIH